MKQPSIAIVGSETLLGKEIRELARDRSLHYHFLHIGVENEDSSRIAEEDGEPVVITPLDAAHLAAADAVLLAGSSASSHKAWELLAPHRDMIVIDVSRTLEDIPSCRIFAPILDPEAKDPEATSESTPAIIAHPAATSIALFFSKLDDFAIRRSIVQVFEPASELGQNGIDELHQQTMRLFAFQSLPKTVYDAQLAYNLLPRNGEEAIAPLDQIEQTIERHLASLMDGGRAPLPSLRLVQAPVFHGYSFSLWVEFETTPTKENLAMRLFAEDDPPNNVGIAGQNGVSIGDVRADRNHPRAFWFWMASDNLRVSAENAIQLLQQRL